jgi:FixJ family two-component response regulator
MCCPQCRAEYAKESSARTVAAPLRGAEPPRARGLGADRRRARVQRAHGQSARGNVMRKTEAASLPDLVRLAEALGVEPMGL